MGQSTATLPGPASCHERSLLRVCSHSDSLKMPVQVKGRVRYSSAGWNMLSGGDFRSCSFSWRNLSLNLLFKVSYGAVMSLSGERELANRGQSTSSGSGGEEKMVRDR